MCFRQMEFEHNSWNVIHLFMQKAFYVIRDQSSPFINFQCSHSHLQKKRKKNPQQVSNWVDKQSWLFLYWNQFTLGLAHIYFRNKTFLFVKKDSWNFKHLFDLGFHETLQNFSSFRQNTEKNRNKSCLYKLNELKFCEVSRNPKSNRC